MTGLALLLFALVPGFPTGILFVMGFLLIAIGYIIYMVEAEKDNAFTRFIRGTDAKVNPKQKLEDEEKTKTKTKTTQYFNRRSGY